MRGNRSRRRERQFSQIRLNHSRSLLSKSQYNPNNLSNSRLTKHTRQQNEEHKDHTVVCVNCYNKKLSIGKREKERLQKTKDKKMEALSLSQIEDRRQKSAKNYQQELQKVNNFNLKKIEENQKNRQIERKITQDQISFEVHKKEEDYRQQIEFKRNIQNERRQKLKQELQKQIQIAKNRRVQQQQEQKNNQMRPIIERPVHNQELRQRKQNMYKQELMNQMSANKIKKMKEAERQFQNEKENQISLVTFAQNRKAQAYQQALKIKESIIDDQKKRKEIQVKNRHNQSFIREKEEQRRKMIEKENERQLHSKEEQRRNHIQKYLYDLKNQIEQNKQKRVEQFRWLNKETDNCLIAPRQTPDYKQCGCCSKYYPKQYLANFMDSTS